MKFSWHFIWILIVGYLIGYYFRGIGDMSVGRFYKGPSAAQ
jgi:hypothetical protein